MIEHNADRALKSINRLIAVGKQRNAVYRQGVVHIAQIVILAHVDMLQLRRQANHLLLNRRVSVTVDQHDQIPVFRRSKRLLPQPVIADRVAGCAALIPCGITVKHDVEALFNDPIPRINGIVDLIALIILGNVKGCISSLPRCNAQYLEFFVSEIKDSEIVRIFIRTVCHFLCRFGLVFLTAGCKQRHQAGKRQQTRRDPER